MSQGFETELDNINEMERCIKQIFIALTHSRLFCVVFLNHPSTLIQGSLSPLLHDKAAKEREPGIEFDDSLELFEDAIYRTTFLVTFLA